MRSVVNEKRFVTHCAGQHLVRCRPHAAPLLFFPSLGETRRKLARRTTAHSGDRAPSPRPPRLLPSFCFQLFSVPLCPMRGPVPASPRRRATHTDAASSRAATPAARRPQVVLCLVLPCSGALGAAGPSAPLRSARERGCARRAAARMSAPLPPAPA